jgi:hypothetical protein
MSYLARLVQQSGLQLGDQVTPASLSNDATSVDPQEIEEVRELAAPSTVRAEEGALPAPPPAQPNQAAPAGSILPVRPADAPTARAAAVGEHRPDRAVPATGSEPGARPVESEQPGFESTLRRVLTWVAAAPQDMQVGRAEAPVEQEIESTVQAPFVPSDAVPRKVIRPARQVTEAAVASNRVDDAPAPEAPTAIAEVEVIRTARAKPPVAAPARDSAPAADEPASEHVVEEAVTVSIGAIHVRVEGPASAPPLLPAAATRPAPQVRAERQSSGRLARHYLRP